MASIINSTGTGSGLQITSDASGALNIQAGGTNVIQISAAGVVTSPLSSTQITYLGANVTMTSANTWYDGPNTGSIGAANQKWLIIACGSIQNAAGAVYGEIAIHDGTNFLAAQGSVGGNTSWQALGTASYIVTLSGATTFTLKGAANAANSTLLAGGSYNTTKSPTYIIAMRLS